MPDTEANQAEYPQPTSQAAGLGFPLARFVVLLSLATAMVSDLAIGPYSGKETGESALLRELLERLNPGDILLADRYFCSYFMVCLLLAAKVDFVTRLHQRRTADFRRGTRLGAGDHVVVWSRPDKPEWMDQATYEQMPQSIELREVEVAVAQPGFRTEVLVVVTTLTDARRYMRGDIAELYHRRWLAELDIRAIKISMGMDVLRAKSPEMVRRELWTCLLAYNLIRQTLLASAQHADRSPRQLSFTAAMQKIAAGWITVVLLDDDVLAVLIESHWDDLAKHKIGHRPNRIEPRDQATTEAARFTDGASRSGPRQIARGPNVVTSSLTTGSAIQVRPLFRGKRFDEMLLRGRQHALKADHQQIVDQMGMNALGSATHVILLEATDPLADRGFNLSLRFHGDLERAWIPVCRSGRAISCRRNWSRYLTGNGENIGTKRAIVTQSGLCFLGRSIEWTR